MPDATAFKTTTIAQEPQVTTNVKYKRWKRPGDPTSWDPNYKPERRELKDRIVSDYMNRHQSRGAVKGLFGGGTLGAIGGSVLGAGIGALAGRKNIGVGALIGGGFGTVVGSSIGSAHGAEKGWQRGRVKGQEFVKSIPKEAGSVTGVVDKRGAKRYFARHKHMDKHLIDPYHKDYKVKKYITQTHTQEISDPAYPWNDPRKEVSVSTKVKKSKKREVAPIATGFAKHGYYREEIIEAVLGKVFRTVTGKRKKINQNVRSAVKVSQRARSEHNMAKAQANFMRRSDGSVLSPKNPISYERRVLRARAEKAIVANNLGSAIDRHVWGKTNDPKVKQAIKPVVDNLRQARKLRVKFAKGQRAAKAMAR